MNQGSIKLTLESSFLRRCEHTFTETSFMLYATTYGVKWIETSGQRTWIIGELRAEKNRSADRVTGGGARMLVLGSQACQNKVSTRLVVKGLRHSLHQKTGVTTDDDNGERIKLSYRWIERIQQDVCNALGIASTRIQEKPTAASSPITQVAAHYDGMSVVDHGTPNPLAFQQSRHEAGMRKLRFRETNVRLSRASRVLKFCAVLDVGQNMLNIDGGRFWMLCKYKALHRATNVGLCHDDGVAEHLNNRQRLGKDNFSSCSEVKRMEAIFMRQMEERFSDCMTLRASPRFVARDSSEVISKDQPLIDTGKNREKGNTFPLGRILNAMADVKDGTQPLDRHETKDPDGRISVEESFSCTLNANLDVVKILPSLSRRRVLGYSLRKFGGITLCQGDNVHINI
ncbi:hypothetical protein IW261DRAFT_1686022 [Armillaria novae-zelandiae]|uniref:Uncharacterized protein n=1 Tax=Armillaria novae-zelandiae TaxID=153914 RepID=A0AA39NHJ9_9AGAR|nr:hypothetical protein IW261DRAFT_1686022 [Armillaria novae-zelandiae]